MGEPPSEREPLVTYEESLTAGRFVDRPNRFTVLVEIDDREAPVYLRNSGGLETVLDPDRAVLCRPVDDPDRKTNYDAIAVDVDGVWATVDATLPNRVVEACLDGRTPVRIGSIDGPDDRTGGLVDRFDGYEVVRTEPPLPRGGRSDLLLSAPNGAETYVEVKSNTYVVDGVSKFPDRPTERGRRHLRHLTELAADPDREAHVVFVVQRPDVDRVRPFRAVDPDFADLLTAAVEGGVGVHAIATAFDPPAVRLASGDVPVEVR